MPDKLQKFIASLDERMRRKLKDKLIQLKSSPFTMKGVKKLHGWGANAYRLRVGDIRVIYSVNGNDVEIIDMDFRGNIY